MGRGVHTGAMTLPCDWIASPVSRSANAAADFRVFLVAAFSCSHSTGHLQKWYARKINLYRAVKLSVGGVAGA